MRRGAESVLERRRARSARALSWLLLLLVGYGATLGVVHRHGPPRQLRISDSSTAESAAASPNGDPSSRLPSHPGDCSICQFQRHLNGGLLYTPVFVPAPVSYHTPAHVEPDFYLSAT